MTAEEAAILRERWCARKKQMVPEWQNFEAFRAWCESKGWTPEWRIDTIQKGQLMGPDTTGMHLVVKDAEDMREGPGGPVRPGFSGRPCTGCRYESCNLSRQCPCKTYLRWYDATMEAYRKGNGL